MRAPQHPRQPRCLRAPADEDGGAQRPTGSGHFRMRRDFEILGEDMPEISKILELRNPK